MRLFDGKPSLFLEVAQKVNAKTGWEAFNKPLLSQQTQVSQTTTELPQGDWTENWFFKGNHIYEYLSKPICSIDDFTLEEIIGALNKVGVHPNQKNSFIPGEYYRGDVNLPGPFGADHVITTAIYDDNGNQIGARNTTEMDHFLHPGIVERTVIKQNNSYYIYTQGGGYGSWGLANIWFDEEVWYLVDRRVINYLKSSKE